MAEGRAFRLADWWVEPAANRLVRGNEEVRVEFKVMEVMRCLAENSGQVVSKSDLIDRVWQTEFIAENTLAHAIAELRRALGDDARRPSYIQTIPKRGYRLLPPVEWVQAHSAAMPTGALGVLVEEPDPPVFVARDAELAKLDTLLSRVSEGHGTAAFIAGEAGTGKTALANEFCRRAIARHPELVVASGACNAATGAGDPYGPWRQVLAQLTGDIETGAATGLLGRVQAARLRSLSFEAGRAVAETGIDLVDTLIPGPALLKRMATVEMADGSWLETLRRQVELRAMVQAAADIRQSALFEQAARVVRRLAETRPVVLIVEDLHWIDAGSAHLLFHLGRRLAGCGVLVVGTYRASEIAFGRGDLRHPMEHVLHELKREHGDTVVELRQTGDRAFVEAFLDSEPNRLDHAFREALFRQTGGHALFTVEMLRTMQERGALVRDGDGFWTAGKALDWRKLPARVEGVLEERLGRLPVELRELLTVAAVEGEEFTAEVVARVREIPSGEVVKTLGQELERRHRLVSGCGLRHLPWSRVSRYRFGHGLFSSHLYGALDEAERAYLHEDVASALEELYGNQVDQVAAELALHFEEAGLVEKAASYLGLAAGRACGVSAFAEAASLSRRALELVDALPGTGEHERVAIEHLQMLLVATAASSGWFHPQVRELATELRKRCAHSGDITGVCWALFLLISHHGNRGELTSLSSLLSENFELAESTGDPLLVMMANWCYLYLNWAGEPARALSHLETAESLLNDEIAERFLRLNGFDPRPIVPTWIGISLMFLGHVERAAARFLEAVELADALGNQFTRAFVRGLAGPTLVSAGVTAGTVLSNECMAIATERGFDEFRLSGMLGQAWSAAMQNDPEPNERLIALIEDVGWGQALPWCLRVRCRLLVAAGQAEEALAQIRRALALIEQGGQRLDESGLHRLEGDAAMLLGDREAAERAYLQAIEVARCQATKTFELEAATALARLRQSQGEIAGAREALQPVHDWFTEGHETAPLREARSLLDALGR